MFGIFIYLSPPCNLTGDIAVDLGIARPSCPIVKSGGIGSFCGPDMRTCRVQLKFLPDGSFGDPAFNLWPEFVGCQSGGDGGREPSHVESPHPAISQSARKRRIRSRVRGVPCDVVIGRREISRAQLIGKSTEGGKERQNRNSDNGEKRKLNLEKE